jgi:hypothetical protein
MGEILAPGRSPGRNSAPQDRGQSTRLVKQLVVESCGARWLIDKYLRSSVQWVPSMGSHASNTRRQLDGLSAGCAVFISMGLAIWFG